MNKPLYTSSLVQVRTNEVIPETLLQKLCSENPTALGYVVREPDKLVVDKFPKLETPDKNYETLRKLLIGRKKFPAMFCFHDFPMEFDEDEIQPFVPLRDSKGSPLLAVGIEGDFPKYVDTSADGFSEAYMLMYEWLGPKIEAMYKTIGNSPQKLFEYLKSDQFRSDFAPIYGHRGVLTFMPSVGEAFVIASKDEALGVQGPWGEASNSYGYTEAVIAAATPAKVEPKAVKTTLGASKYAVEDPATPPVEQPVIPKVDPAPVTDPVKKAVEGVAPEWKDVYPPKDFHGKQLKGWYRSADPSAELPPNWREKPPVKMRVTKHMQTPEADAPKDFVHTVGNTTIVTKGETLPIIGATMQKSASDFIKKHLGDGSAVITDPLKAQEEELKLATFTQLMAASGIKSLADIKRMRTSFLALFVKQHPEASWLLVLQLRAEVDRLEKALAEGNKKLGELSGTVTAPESPASTVSKGDVHQLAKEELKPVKAASGNKSKYA